MITAEEAEIFTAQGGGNLSLGMRKRASFRMKGGSVTGNRRTDLIRYRRRMRRRARERRLWRIRSVRRAAGRGKPVLRPLLYLTLAAEAAYLGSGCLRACGRDITLVRTETEYRWEWPGEEKESFGIRFRPDTMELEFYRTAR